MHPAVGRNTQTGNNFHASGTTTRGVRLGGISGGQTRDHCCRGAAPCIELAALHVITATQLTGAGGGPQPGESPAAAQPLLQPPAAQQRAAAVEAQELQQVTRWIAGVRPVPEVTRSHQHDT